MLIKKLLGNLLRASLRDHSMGSHKATNLLLIHGLSKRVENCAEFEEEGNGATTVPSDVKEGHVAVIAVKGEKVVRFVLELQELYKPEFRKLLEQAGEEFGFQPRGSLTIPCQPEEVQKILQRK
ncbi:hypothetical protein Bca4012_074678 [Brassica carinata]